MGTVSNNSPVYWTANGLSLHTRAWSVRSFGGRRFFGPGKRGADTAVPFRNGRLPVKKSREAQALDLDMWVIPLTPDGLKDGVLTREQRAHTNYRTLVSTLDIDGQFPIIKRWYDGTEIVAATGYAEYLEGSGPPSDDGRGFSCGFTLTMADPYFYQAAISTGLTAGVTNVDVQGEVPTDHVIVKIVSGSNVRVTLPDGNWIQFNDTISGTEVIIDCHNGSVTRGNQFVNGLVSRNPLFPEWFRLTPGVTPVTVSGGTAILTYEPAYR